MIENYGKVPRDCTTDGGYASLANQSYAKGKGIINIVFNKIVGSLANIATSKNMETRLKKWRSGMEAHNFQHQARLQPDRCTWKGFEHFEPKSYGASLPIISG